MKHIILTLCTACGATTGLGDSSPPDEASTPSLEAGFDAALPPEASPDIVPEAAPKSWYCVGGEPSLTVECGSPALWGYFVPGKEDAGITDCTDPTPCSQPKDVCIIYDSKTIGSCFQQ